MGVAIEGVGKAVGKVAAVGDPSGNVVGEVARSENRKEKKVNFRALDLSPPPPSRFLTSLGSLRS